MPAPAPLPVVSSPKRPKAPVRGFEDNEISEIIRAAGEQIGGYKHEPLHPIPGYDTLDKLKGQDEIYKKSNYPTLKERLRHIAEANKQRVASAKQQEEQKNRRTEELKNKSTQNADAGKGKGSLKDRMFSAMGIRRKRSAGPSAAEMSATREFGAKKTQ